MKAKSGGLGSICVGGVRFNFDVAQKYQCAELVTVNFGVLGANRTSQVPFRVRRPDARASDLDSDHRPYSQSAIKRDSRSAKNGPGFVDLLPAAGEAPRGRLIVTSASGSP